MQGTYEIYWYKDQDATPNAVESPTTNMTTSPRTKNDFIKSGAMIGMGLAVAKRTIDTIRNEIGATTGNEILQNNINNSMKALGYVAIVASTGLAGAVLVGTDVTLNAITYARDLRRQNVQAGMERELQGKRMRLASGRAYYG